MFPAHLNNIKYFDLDIIVHWSNIAALFSEYTNELWSAALFLWIIGHYSQHTEELSNAQNTDSELVIQFRFVTFFSLVELIYLSIYRN